MAVADTATAGVRHRHESVTRDPQQVLSRIFGRGVSVSADMQAFHTPSVRRRVQASVMEAALQLLAWIGVVVATSVAAAVAVGILFG
jgi:hypothetical protein